MKEPELIDPIYNELLHEAKNYSDQYKKLAAEAAAAKDEWEKTDGKDGHTRAPRKRYYAKMKETDQALQMQQYYELRANSRRTEARKLYMAAFQKDLPWPDPAEYEAYQAEMRLKKANKSWDARTPKWSARIAKLKGSSGKKPSSKPSEHESSGSGGSEHAAPVEHGAPAEH